MYEEGIVIKLSNVALTLDPMVLIKEPSSLEQEPFKSSIMQRCFRKNIIAKKCCSIYDGLYNYSLHCVKTKSRTMKQVCSLPKILIRSAISGSPDSINQRTASSKSIGKRWRFKFKYLKAHGQKIVFNKQQRPHSTPAPHDYWKTQSMHSFYIVPKSYFKRVGSIFLYWLIVKHIHLQWDDHLPLWKHRLRF